MQFTFLLTKFKFHVQTFANKYDIIILFNNNFREECIQFIKFGTSS